MIGPSVIYGSALVALGAWATFTLSKTWASRDARGPHRAMLLVGSAFVVSCWFPGLALLGGGFRPWMLVPLGLSYIALIPLPCYFGWANHGRVRRARRVLFLLVGAALVAAGLHWLPVSWFGL